MNTSLRLKNLSIAYTGSSRVVTQISIRTTAIHGSRIPQPAQRGMKGYYVRPSRAIEKGGGFFVPGLEGGKIRVVSAGILLLLIYLSVRGTLTVMQLDTNENISLVVGLVSSSVLFGSGMWTIIQDLVDDRTLAITTEQPLQLTVNRFSNEKFLLVLDGIMEELTSSVGSINYAASFQRSQITSDRCSTLRLVYERSAAPNANASIVTSPLAEILVRNGSFRLFSNFNDKSSVGSFEIGLRPCNETDYAIINFHNSTTISQSSMRRFLPNIPPSTSTIGTVMLKNGVLWLLGFNTKNESELVNNRRWIETLFGALNSTPDKDL